MDSWIIDGLVASIAAKFSPSKPLNIVGIRTRGEIIAARVARLHQQAAVHAAVVQRVRPAAAFIDLIAEQYAAAKARLCS